MPQEQGTKPAGTTLPADQGGNQPTGQTAGQGGSPADNKPSEGEGVKEFELDGEKITAEQIKDFKTKAASYDELRPKFTKLTQRLAELEDEDDEGEEVPPTGQPAGGQGLNPITAEILALKKQVANLTEKAEDSALEKQMTELKGKYPDMDDVEVLAALSVDPKLDPEEAAKFSDKRNKEKIESLRKKLEKEGADNQQGRLEHGAPAGGNIPPAGKPASTIQEAGKRFLERMRAAKAAAQ